MARTKSWMNLRMFILTFLASLLGFYCSILFYYPTKCIQNSNILRKPRKPKSHPIPIKQLPVTSLPPETPQLKLISPPFLSSFPDDGHSTIQHNTIYDFDILVSEQTLPLPLPLPSYQQTTMILKHIIGNCESDLNYNDKTKRQKVIFDFEMRNGFFTLVALNDGCRAVLGLVGNNPEHTQRISRSINLPNNQFQDSASICNMTTPETTISDILEQRSIYNDGTIAAIKLNVPIEISILLLQGVLPMLNRKRSTNEIMPDILLSIDALTRIHMKETVICIEELMKHLGYRLFLLIDPWKTFHFNSLTGGSGNYWVGNKNNIVQKKWSKIYTMSNNIGEVLEVLNGKRFVREVLVDGTGEFNLWFSHRNDLMERLLKEEKEDIVDRKSFARYD